MLTPHLVGCIWGETIEDGFGDALMGCDDKEYYKVRDGLNLGWRVGRWIGDVESKLNHYWWNLINAW